MTRPTADVRVDGGIIPRSVFAMTAIRPLAILHRLADAIVETI